MIGAGLYYTIPCMLRKEQKKINKVYWILLCSRPPAAKASHITRSLNLNLNLKIENALRRVLHEYR